MIVVTITKAAMLLLSESVGVAIIPIAAILILAGNNIDKLFSDI